MNISVLQHAASEGPGEIEVWAHKRFHHVETCHLYRGDALPVWSSFDLLVVMGGEMNIYQDRDWPWLKPERELIEAALAAGKPVVGICLGSQLIADALGSRVTQNPEIELGWQPVTWTPEARAYCPEVPAESTVLHWHGDTYELPDGAIRLATSAVCGEQGYVIPGKCLAFQFHMEVDPKITADYVASQPNWPQGEYVQSSEEVLAHADNFCAANKSVLFALLDRFLREELITARLVCGQTGPHRCTGRHFRCRPAQPARCPHSAEPPRGSPMKAACSRNRFGIRAPCNRPRR